MDTPPINTIVQRRQRSHALRLLIIGFHTEGDVCLAIGVSGVTVIGDCGVLERSQLPSLSITIHTRYESPNGPNDIPQSAAIPSKSAADGNVACAR